MNYTVSESSIELGTECIDTPCVFSPRSLPGETISIFVYAESHSFNSLPAIIQHSTGNDFVEVIFFVCFFMFFTCFQKDIVTCTHLVL